MGAFLGVAVGDGVPMLVEGCCWVSPTPAVGRCEADMERWLPAALGGQVFEVGGETALAAFWQVITFLPRVAFWAGLLKHV